MHRAHPRNRAAWLAAQTVKEPHEQANRRCHGRWRLSGLERGDSRSRESFGEPRLGMRRRSRWLRRLARKTANDSARLPDTQRNITARWNDSRHGESREILRESWPCRESRVAEGIARWRKSRHGRARLIRARVHRWRRHAKHRATAVRIRNPDRRCAEDYR